MKFGKTVRLIGMLGLTGGFFFVEIIVGYMTGSMALVADSFHMLSDVIALVIGLLSVRISRKESEKNTFGWARAEILGALVNAVFLCALCFSIFVESIQRFVEGVEIINPRLVLIVGAVGLGVNIIGLFLFHDHVGHSHGHSHHHSEGSSDLENGHSHHGHGHSHGHNHSHGATMQIETAGGGPVVVKKKTASSSQMNMKGVFLHVAGDALGSVVVIIAACVIEFTDWEYKNYIDPAMSLLSVAVILAMTIPLLYSSALILLQTVPLHIKARDIKARLEKVDGVLAVHELHIWQLAGNRIVASAHVWCRNYQEYKRSANRIKELFHDEGIHSTTIQPEFEDFDETGRFSITPLDSAYCGLICPEDNNCEENMCCKPARSTSRRESDTGRNSIGVNSEHLETTLRRHLGDIPLQSPPSRPTLSPGNNIIPSIQSLPEFPRADGGSPGFGRDNPGFAGSTPSIMLQPATPLNTVDFSKPAFLSASPSPSPSIGSGRYPESSSVSINSSISNTDDTAYL